MARAERELLAITGSVNVALLEAMKPLLAQEGTLTTEAIRSAIKRAQFSIKPPSDGKAGAVAAQNLERIDRFNRRDVERAIGVAVPEYSQVIGETWRKKQVGLIKSLGTEPKSRIVDLLRDASKKQTRVETFKRQLEEEFGINERRARLIARDQILSLNAKLNEDRQKKAGITEYVWRSVGDASSRQHHKDLDGQRFAYDEPPMGGGTGPNDKGNPGDGIGCRCQAIPVIPEFED